MSFSDLIKGCGLSASQNPISTLEKLEAEANSKYELADKLNDAALLALKEQSPLARTIVVASFLANIHASDAGAAFVAESVHSLKENIPDIINKKISEMMKKVNETKEMAFEGLKALGVDNEGTTVTFITSTCFQSEEPMMPPLTRSLQS